MYEITAKLIQSCGKIILQTFLILDKRSGKWATTFALILGLLKETLLKVFYVEGSTWFRSRYLIHLHVVPKIEILEISEIRALKWSLK